MKYSMIPGPALLVLPDFPVINDDADGVRFAVVAVIS